MGYNSFHNLQIKESDVTIEDVAATLAQVTNDDDDDAAFWESVLSGETDATWYDHSEDLQKVSMRYPDALLILSGEGEESDDQWVEYHRNGKMQLEHMPEWTPAPFDPDKLA